MFIAHPTDQELTYPDWPSAQTTEPNPPASRGPTLRVGR
jgi:hypothetical protein